MAENDPYQRGDSVEWLKYSNEELAALIKRRSRQLQRARSFAVLLMLVLAWVAYKYAQKHPLRELWPF